MRTDILNNRRRRPTHPGELLREEILPHLGMSQGRLAELLDVSRQTINEITTEKRSVSIDMAYRLGRLFSMDPATWIRMQQAVDVWDTLQSSGKEYQRIQPIPAAAVRSEAARMKGASVKAVKRRYAMPASSQGRKVKGHK